MTHTIPNRSAEVGRAGCSLVAKLLCLAAVIVGLAGLGFGCAPIADVLPAAARPAPEPEHPSTVFTNPWAEIPIEAEIEPPVEDAATTDDDTSNITVGILLPLSGADAPAGHTMLDSAAMAVFDTADERFVLRPYDTLGTPDGARAAAEHAISDGARLLVGPLFGRSVAAASGVARAAGVNIIAFSNDRTVASPGTFLIGYLPQTEVEQLIAFAKARGVKRIAALVPDDPFGRRVAQALRSAAESKTIDVARVETYDDDTPSIETAIRRLGNYDDRRKALEDLRDQLRSRNDPDALEALDRLKDQNTWGDVDFDAVLVPTASDMALTVGSRFPYFDIPSSKVRLMGLSTWDQLNIAREPAFAGAWYVDPGSGRGLGFRNRFSRLHGYAPNRLAFLAYDATAVAATLARLPDGPDFSVAAITQRNGFSGVSGLFRFRDDGLCERRYGISEVTPEGVRHVGRAWETFDRGRTMAPGS